MNTKLRLDRGAGAVVVAALLTVLAGCSVGPAGRAADTAPPQTASTDHASSTSLGSVRIVLRVGDEAVRATLADTAATRQFVAMLPRELILRDPMGQAKSGRLPSPIDVTGAEPVFDARVGELYYWAPSNTIAIFYEDLGHSIPAPGLVRLGAVDSGLTSIRTAGNRFPVRIELAGRTVGLTGR